MTVSIETKPMCQPITYYNPSKGEFTKYFMPIDEYEEFTRIYEENEYHWRKYNILCPTDLAIAVLILQSI